MKTYFTFSLAILFSLFSCKKNANLIDEEVGQNHEDASNIKSEFDNTNNGVFFTQ
ncbi:MAG: hypothetical protein IPK03_10545 [Bacteroidetes bacterium]|nr:hypothetical protein [Bacteroidota bacterium]